MRALTVVLLIGVAIIVFCFIFIVAWFTFTFQAYPPETAVVFRFGEPHREVSGFGLRFPSPVEEVHFVTLGRVNLTEVNLQPRDQDAPSGKGYAYWLAAKATDFLLNTKNPEAGVKEAVESASHNLSTYPTLHGALPCSLIVDAQSVLNEKKLGIKLWKICLRGTGLQCFPHRCGLD